MNKEQIKGTVKDVAGKIEEKVGQLTGNKQQEARGDAKQVAGKTEKLVGDAKQAVKKGIDRI
jgi:uncharacterized protein YjbJ (UPF0337 family)